MIDSPFESEEEDEELEGAGEAKRITHGSWSLLKLRGISSTSSSSMGSGGGVRPEG